MKNYRARRRSCDFQSRAESIAFQAVVLSTRDARDGRIQPPTGLFVAGWIVQLVGHAFEGMAPEFFYDWRFLFVGLRWWVAKVRGRA